MMSFMARMREFFGQKPGQSLVEFAKELSRLNHEERVRFVAQFNAQGLDTEQPK